MCIYVLCPFSAASEMYMHVLCALLSSYRVRTVMCVFMSFVPSVLRFQPLKCICVYSVLHTEYVHVCIYVLCPFSVKVSASLHMHVLCAIYYLRTETPIKLSLFVLCSLLTLLVLERHYRYSAI